MKNYVLQLTYTEEWELMKMAIAKKDTNLIRHMLRDGYGLTLPLLEAVHRFIDQASLLLIVNSYPGDLEEEADCMLFLRECLEPKLFESVMENNRKKIERIAKEQAAEKQKRIAEIFEEAEKEYGDTPHFYGLMCGENDTLEYALNKYGEDALFKALERHGVLYDDQDRTSYDTWYLRGFSFEYLMSHNHIKAAAVWLTSAVTIHDVENYDECLSRVVNAGGLKDLITYSAPLGYGSLLEDENIRNKVKTFGAEGYKKLYKHARDYFTLDDWYKWYELDAQEAIKYSADMGVPKKWLLKHKHFSQALGFN